MARRGTRDSAVGALFALALIILAFGVMAVGNESRLFSSKVEYLAVFPSTDGLSVGSPVKMAGVQIGTVSRVRLPTDPERTGITVSVAIDEDYAVRVREDSRAGLRIQQYLTGEKAVEIKPGTPQYPVLPEGALIAPDEDRELLAQMGEASQNLNDIMISLKNILAALESGEGLFGKAINDPKFGSESLEGLRGSLTNLKQLTDDVIKGRGLVGRLLYDEEIAGKLDDLGRAIESVASLVESVDLESGALGELLREDGAGSEAVADLRDSAASLKVFASRLETGEGLVGALTRDGDYSRQVAGDLERMVQNLADISEKINRGEGTLGALVNERVLYDGMEDMVAGVNDSKFARWLLRHYRKKGIKVEDELAAELERASQADSDNQAEVNQAEVNQDHDE